MRGAGLKISLFFILVLMGLGFILALNEGIVKFTFGSENGIRIESPVNYTTYNFSKGVPYTLDLNVSWWPSTLALDSWWYTLIDLRHNGKVIYENVSFSPNVTFNATRWDNQLIVYANDTTGNLYTDSVQFFVFVNNSAPLILPFSPEIYACENKQLSYIFNATDIDEDQLDASISHPIPFYVSYQGMINLTSWSYRIYSGSLNKDDAGGVNAGSKTYQKNISVEEAFTDDQYVDTKSINITVIEVNNPPVLQNIGVQTIWTRGDNSTFYYPVSVYDIEDGSENSGNLTFSISFSGEKLFNISQNGVMNYTANETSPVGVHNISVCATDRGILNPHPNITSVCGQDGSPLTSCENFSLTITDQNRPPNITSHYPENLSLKAKGSDVLYFNITEYDADGTIPDAYWYVDGIEKEYDSGSLTDDFFYSFGCGISGRRKVKVVITDGELNDSLEWNISVSGVECPTGKASSGGGGGGGSALECTESWGCGDWTQCSNLKESYDSKKVGYEVKKLISERCSLFGWPDSICGFQTRDCVDLNKCRTNKSKPGVLRECYYTKNPTCRDNIKNCHDGFCELKTDCGGPCAPCPTCSDGIRNQGEAGIDCGGPCPNICVEIPEKPLTPYYLLFSIILLLVILIVIVSRLLIRYIVAQRKLKKIEKEEARKKPKQ